MPKVSIVMPVYNAGEYLRVAIQGVIDQTFSDWELICVDDGSTDNSLEVLEGFAEQDDRIVIIAQNNQGAGAARNKGFENVHGEYTIFLDSDDLFDEKLLVSLYTQIVKDDADLCICGARFFHVENSEIHLDHSVDVPLEIDWSNTTMLLQIPHVPWNRLYRTAFIRNNQFQFQSLVSSNDLYFVCITELCAERIALVHNNSLILYRTQNSNQISANRNPINAYYAVEKIREELKNRGRHNERYDEILDMLLINRTVAEIKSCNDEVLNRAAYECTAKHLLKQNKSLSVPYYNKQCHLFVNYPYGFKWYDENIDYYDQLRYHSAMLLSELKGYNYIYLWGYGQRGKAFERFCKEMAIHIKGIYDRKFGDGDVIKRMLEKNADCIIASNHSIYDDICFLYSIRILDLEYYCPV